MKLSNDARRNGFSLIELVMTIVVVTIVAIPLSVFIGEQLRGMIQSSTKVTAINLARLELAKVSNMSYASIVSGSFSNYEGYSYDVIRTVSFIHGSNTSHESLKQVAIEVMPTGSLIIEANLVTYFAKNVGHGI